MMSDSRSRAIGANQHLGADCRLVGELQHDTVDVLFVAAHAAGHTVRELKQRFRTDFKTVSNANRPKADWRAASRGHL